MIVKLQRHSFPDKPEWLLIEEKVPLGTEFEVIGFIEKGFVVLNTETLETREVECYLVDGNGDKGWLPKIVFDEIKK